VSSYKLEILDSQTADYYYYFISAQILPNPTGKTLSSSPSSKADMTSRWNLNNKRQYHYNPF